MRDLKKPIQKLQNIVSRKGSSKPLTFSIPHVFKAIQLLRKENFVSRSQFCNELFLGEGAVKTLIKHLKYEKIADTTKSGTFLTEEGKKIADYFAKTIPHECTIKKCSLVTKKHNHAIILREFADVVKTGLEQRDYAILYGSEGCVTLAFKNGKFIFPSDGKVALHGDKQTTEFLHNNLNPQENDVIIISSSNDPFVAEISAKNSALSTLAEK